MTRTKISLPDEFLFSAEIPVRIADINLGGHVGHESFFVIIEEARVQFLQNIGYTENNISGSGLIMTDASIVYLKQGRYGQNLKVDIAVDDFTTRGFDILYRVSDAGTGVEIARAKTGFLLYDYQKQKVANIPQEFKSKIYKQR